MIEKIKAEIKNISFFDIELNKEHGDGRINSSNDEEIIFNKLKESNYFKNKIKKSNKERNWYDFCISFKDEKNDEIFIPVNIKVVKGNKGDNLNCKLGIYYSLTGKIPCFSNEIVWKKYFSKLKENMEKNQKDYFFLIINKEKLSHNFIGLREINKFVPNGNNLPFQCNFDDVKNKTINKDSYEEDRIRILDCFYESIKKRTTIKDYFEENFVENGKIK